MNISFRVRSLINRRVTTTDYGRVTTTDYPYESMTVGAILYGCPQSGMVAPNLEWLPPIWNGCPQSGMVALIISCTFLIHLPPDIFRWRFFTSSDRLINKYLSSLVNLSWALR